MDLSLISKYIIYYESFNLWYVYWFDPTDSENRNKSKQQIIIRLIILGFISDFGQRYFKNP